MTNRIAFVFKTAPHGSSSGREGLDALLSISSLNGKAGVFFISDGIFQIVAHQKPITVLSRDYVSTFKVLPICEVNVFWVCESSLHERGLDKNSEFVIDITLLSEEEIYEKLIQYQAILSF